jgi:hypothetical protein
MPNPGWALTERVGKDVRIMLDAYFNLKEMMGQLDSYSDVPTLDNGIEDYPESLITLNDDLSDTDGSIGDLRDSLGDYESKYGSAMGDVERSLSNLREYLKLFYTLLFVSTEESGYLPRNYEETVKRLGTSRNSWIEDITDECEIERMSVDRGVSAHIYDLLRWQEEYELRIDLMSAFYVYYRCPAGAGHLELEVDGPSIRDNKVVCCCDDESHSFKSLGIPENQISPEAALAPWKLNNIKQKPLLPSVNAGDMPKSKLTLEIVNAKVEEMARKVGILFDSMNK